MINRTLLLSPSGILAYISTPKKRGCPSNKDNLSPKGVLIGEVPCCHNNTQSYVSSPVLSKSLMSFPLLDDPTNGSQSPFCPIEHW